MGVFTDLQPSLLVYEARMNHAHVDETGAVAGRTSDSEFGPTGIVPADPEWYTLPNFTVSSREDAINLPATDHPHGQHKPIFSLEAGTHVLGWFRDVSVEQAQRDAEKAFGPNKNYSFIDLSVLQLARPSRAVESLERLITESKQTVHSMISSEEKDPRNIYDVRGHHRFSIRPNKAVDAKLALWRNYSGRVDEAKPGFGRVQSIQYAACMETALSFPTLNVCHFADHAAAVNDPAHTPFIAFELFYNN